MVAIRVLIVEDDMDWLRGLSAYLSKEPDIEVVGQARSSEEALIAIRETQFDVVLMDIMLASKAEGIWLAGEVSQSCTAKVIMLTSMQENELIFDAFKAGAMDYLVKSDFEKIPEAVRSAAHHQSSINASVAEQIREEFRRLKQMEHDYKVKEVEDLITPAELQVLELIDQGNSQPEIANRLFVSLRTVKVHVNNILKKLGGTSSKEAAQKVRELGLFKKKR